MPRATGIKQAATNRKALHDYFVLERFEAGVELFAHGIHISPYEHGSYYNRDPDRPKRLLMHKREILRLNARVMQDGLTLVPLSLYFKDSRVKVELGLCKGKKLYDKRDAAAERSAKREIDRTIKEKNYQ